MKQKEVARKIQKGFGPCLVLLTQGHPRHFSWFIAESHRQTHVIALGLHLPVDIASVIYTWESSIPFLGHARSLEDNWDSHMTAGNTLTTPKFLALDFPAHVT